MFEKYDSFTFFPAQPWAHTWERPHELIYRLSNEIKRKVYILPPLGLVEYNFFDITMYKKIRKKIMLMKSETNKNRSLDNMIFINSLYVHKFDNLSTKINFKLLTNKIKFTENNFFWAAYVNPTIYEFFKKSKFKILDLAERRQGNFQISEKMRELEKKAVKEANIVFVDNMITYNDYKNLNKNIFYIPQGYDNKEIVLNFDNKGTKIGYIGNLHSSIDYNYLFELIKINSEREFLIVGKIMDENAKQLFRFNNVEMVGEVKKEELMKYLVQMQYGLIPYKINEFTKGVFPTKLFEYLGAGVPVISTEIPEVVQYKNDKYVFIENRPSIIDYEPDFQGLEEFLKENTWNSRFKLYLKCLKDVM